jgi:hypothetical protein
VRQGHDSVYLPSPDFVGSLRRVGDYTFSWESVSASVGRLKVKERNPFPNRTVPFHVRGQSATDFGHRIIDKHLLSL